MIEKLLSEYKKYDYLNRENKKNLVKILVSYIKPSFLFQSEILTPIHLGRTVAKEISKDGKISETDLKWLYDNCIGDDNFSDNISHTNRRIGFLTGTYWAWKNYEKLGNPEYFGSFGYRKLFNPTFLNDLQDYDLVLPQKDIQNPTLKTFFIQSHGEKIYNTILQVLNEKHIKDVNDFEKYMDLNTGYMFEIYVLKKNLFFNFCEWIFPILFELLNYKNEDLMPDEAEKDRIIKFFASTNGLHICNLANFELYQTRLLAFALERLTGYYLYKLSQNHNYLEQEVIQANTISKEQQFKLLREKMKEKHV